MSGSTISTIFGVSWAVCSPSNMLTALPHFPAVDFQKIHHWPMGIHQPLLLQGLLGVVVSMGLESSHILL